MGLPSVPASTHSICLYAAYLACMLKFSSIKQHHGIIGLMHIEFGLDNLIGDWQLSSLLAGVKCIQGNAPKQNLPINFDILRGIHSQLNLTYSVDAAFWAIWLVAFFGIFHKSHLLITKVRSYELGKQLTKANFSFFPGGILVQVHWSKTIQFREKVVRFHLWQPLILPSVQFLLSLKLFPSPLMLPTTHRFSSGYTLPFIFSLPPLGFSWLSCTHA